MSCHHHQHHHHQITKFSHSINAIGPAPHRGGRMSCHVMFNMAKLAGKSNGDCHNLWLQAVAAADATRHYSNRQALLHMHHMSHA
jgi:hypothetical protein